MKKLLIAILLIVFLPQKIKATHWLTSFEDAQKLAIATNKLIVVDFWATWCGPCKAMDANTWSKPEVQTVLNNFIPLKLDIDINHSLALKYNVKSIPYVFIIDSNGEVLFQRMSYMNEIQVIEILKKYSYVTKLMQDELLSYYKNKTGDNALQLAEKYLDYSIYVKDEVKKDFLRLGKDYLKKTYKLYKKEGDSKKNKQRIDLLTDVYIAILQGDYTDALKKLNKKFDENKIEDSNKTLYNFLNYIAYSKIQDRENAKLWYKKLEQMEGYQSFFLKSRKI
ncbi:thioredoxin family protein [Tenacibaculum sp. UWU-22]|uniref:thioredoxin family protein n=1 Tax=Tenacibaculum sp. UWU-22 TaxID=3234187 RepID=UPI0034DB566D